ncbi:RNA-directed DNA polymerase, eukaryota, reverse transcriptase zinc-binding domain protein [Tanacetum coccineum]
MTMCGVALNTLGTFVITLNGATRDQEVENPNTVDHITNIENENNNNDYVSVINKETNGEKQSFTAMFKKPTPLKAARLSKMTSKRLAFPLVENYVKNAWEKFGLERLMLTNGFFFFQFATRDGMERVLENGPWLIRPVGTAKTSNDSEASSSKPIEVSYKEQLNVQTMTRPTQIDKGIDLVAIRNSFDVLREKDKVLDVVDTKSTPDPLDDDQDEVENIYTDPDSKNFKKKKQANSAGASTPNESDLSECLLLIRNQKPKGDDGILKKIDRIMANLAFFTSFVGSCAVFQPYRIFDHSPVVLHFPMNVEKKPRPFKFYNLLKLLKKPLRNLLYDHEYLHDNVKKLHHELDEAQKDSDSDLTNIELREEEVAYLNAFHDALLIEERFLVQKSKVKWLKLGDANTAYFYKVVKSQSSRNRIDNITNNNEVCVDGDQVPLVFINHYMEFLGQPGVMGQF